MGSTPSPKLLIKQGVRSASLLEREDDVVLRAVEADVSVEGRGALLHQEYPAAAQLHTEL